MDFKIFLSNEALNDLEGIVLYIAPQNPGAGRANRQPITRRGVVAEHSLGTRSRGAEFRRPELREIIFRSYRIIYRVSSPDQSVEIVRFWHAARGFPQIPRGT